jgi:hypothetical protein
MRVRWRLAAATGQVFSSPLPWCSLRCSGSYGLCCSFGGCRGLSSSAAGRGGSGHGEPPSRSMTPGELVDFAALLSRQRRDPLWCAARAKACLTTSRSGPPSIPLLGSPEREGGCPCRPQ